MVNEIVCQICGTWNELLLFRFSPFRVIFSTCNVFISYALSFWMYPKVFRFPGSICLFIINIYFSLFLLFLLLWLLIVYMCSCFTEKLNKVCVLCSKLFVIFPTAFAQVWYCEESVEVSMAVPKPFPPFSVPSLPSPPSKGWVCFLCHSAYHSHVLHRKPVAIAVSDVHTNRCAVCSSSALTPSCSRVWTQNNDFSKSLTVWYMPFVT